MSLSASSAVFQPQTYLNVDDIIQSILIASKDPQYYIKGGQAFNYYYPQYPVATSDFDLVATNDICNDLFSQLYSLMGHVVRFQSHLIQIVSVYQTDQAYEDLLVRSLFMNETPIVDVIIVPLVDTHEYTIDETSGLHYMEKSAFKADLIQTYEDRLRKSEKKSKNRHTNRKRRGKLERSKDRFEISKQYGRKHRR